MKKLISAATNICVECKMAFEPESKSIEQVEIAENNENTTKNGTHDKPSISPASNKLLEGCVKFLLVRHLKLLICNAHTITGIIRLDMKVSQS